jgi:hypothetical protein
MKQLIFINPETSSYKGYRLEVNNRCKTIRVSSKFRIIEYNYRFFFAITDYQRIFMAEWAIMKKKFPNDYDCDKHTKSKCIKMGIPEEEIYALYNNVRFTSKHNRDQRIYHLVTISPEEYQLNRIISFIKQPFIWLRKKIS